MIEFLEHLRMIFLLAFFAIPVLALIYSVLSARQKIGTTCVLLAVFVWTAMTAHTEYKAKNPEGVEPILIVHTDPKLPYLFDSGSYVSNNVIYLAFSSRTIPEDAPLFLDYIPKTEPFDSENYTTYMAGTLNNFPNPLMVEFENACSNRWVFYTTWTPGPTVHTNGIAVAEFLRHPAFPNVAVPKRTTIWEGGLMVWPNGELIKLSGEGTSTIETED